MMDTDYDPMIIEEDVHLESLPEEIIFQILEQVPPRDLARMSVTDHTMHRICHDDRLWKNKFPLPVKAFNPYETLSQDDDSQSYPSSRLCHAAVVWGDCMYVHGGHNTIPNTQLFNEVKNDFWKFNFQTRQWSQIEAPNSPSKTEHSAVVYDDKLWLFGGYSGNYFTNSLCCFDFKTETWTEVTASGEIPTYRSAHVAGVYGDKMYIFGGWNGANQNNEIYAFEFKTGQWARIQSNGPAPPARCSHTAVVSERLGKLIVYGGYGGKTRKYLSDLCFYDFATNTWSIQPFALSPRSRMRMVLWNDKLYIYGGWNKLEHFNSFNEYDLCTGELRHINESIWKPGDGKIGQHSMVVHSDLLYVFAGFNSSLDTSTNQMFAYRLARPKVHSSMSP